MQCFHPVSIRDPSKPESDDRITVPCGKCFACQSNRRRDWHMRIKYELLHQLCSYTVTLTYDNEHLPPLVYFVDYDPIKEPDKHGFWYHPYDITHVQKFFKRLRKDGFQFRYFGVAEYGTKTARPHYHIIFFFDKPIQKITFQTEVLKQWPYGTQIVVDETNDDCIGYTLKYCLKFYNVHQPGPKIFLSKKPFIGSGYLQPGTVSYLRTRCVDIVPTLSGTHRIPRLLRDKIFTEEMKDILKFKMEQTVSKIQAETISRAAERGIEIVEYKNRMNQAFIKKCVSAIKKKSL